MNDASIEARAYLGLLETSGRGSAAGHAAVQSSVGQLRAMTRHNLGARARVILAQIDVSQKRFNEALATLDEIPADDQSRTLGMELRAQVHFWRARALAGRGDGAGARDEAATARTLIETVRAGLPPIYQAGFAARPDVAELLRLSANRPS